MKTTMLALVLLLGAGSHAQTSIDYRDFLHQSGFHDVHGECLAIHDGCLYLGHFAGMNCYDLADDGSLVGLGSVNILFGAAAIAAADGFAYAVTGTWHMETFHLTAIDVTDPAEPTIVGTAALPAPATDVVVSGNLALVANGWGGVIVFDISDPAAPVELGTIPITSVDGLATASNWAFAAAGDGLHVLDLSVAGLPEIVGSVAIPGGATAVAVTGMTAHVVGSQGLFVVDCADPWHPARQGDVVIAGSQRRVAVADGIAYVAVRDRGLTTVDVGDPWSPRQIGGIPAARDALDVAVSGTTGYLLCFDWRPTEQPGCGIMIIDASNPACPPPIGVLDMGATAHDLCVSDQLAYVITDHGEQPEDLLQVVDASEPQQPRLIATAPLPDGAVEVAMSPPYVVVGYGAGKLLVLDVADPQAIAPLGEIALSAGLNTFVTAGSYAYAGVGYYIWGAIQGADLTDPTDPQIFFETAFGGPGALGTDGEHLIVAGLHGEIHPQIMLVTFDISDPPNVTGGGVLYFENEDPGMVDVAGHRVVMAGSRGEPEFPWPHLRCIDISDPDTPQARGWIHLARWSGGVALDGDVAYVGIGDEYNGALQVYSASDLTQPWLVGGAETAGPLHALTVHDSLVYGLARPSTLIILPTQIAGTTAVGGDVASAPDARLNLAIHPNPCNPRATITFRLDVTTRVEAGVYDVAGAAVATLAARSFGPGDHTLVWDGRDTGGREVASGVYCVRIVAGRATATEKVVLVR